MNNPKYTAFLSIAETGSVKKTAEILGYTQTGISYLINSMEEEWGLKLFVRNYGGTVLTSEGEVLLPYIRSVCNCESLLTNKVSEIKNLDSGLLRIGTISSVHINWLPEMVKDYKRRYPGVEVEMKCCDDYDRLEDMICTGEVDCGFVIMPCKKKLKVEEIYEDQLVAVLDREHPLADSQSFSVSDLDQYPYIQSLVSSESEANAVFALYDKKPNVVHWVDNDFTMLSMISSGYGFAIFPELLLEHLDFPVIAKPLAPKASRKIAFAVRGAGPISQVVRSFQETAFDWVRQWAKDRQAAVKQPSDDR